MPRNGKQKADGARGMRGWAKWAVALAVAGTLCMCGALPLFAAPDAGVAAPDIEARRQALLRQMLQDPSNLDVAFEYASLSSQVGDYEAAISTLERMLIFAPNTPRLQLELGMLYYKLGASELIAGAPDFGRSARQSQRAARGRRQGPALSQQLASPPIRLPSPPHRFRRSAGRATPMPDPARRT